MITGVRGSGKTVLMTIIVNKLKKEWICIELNLERDLLVSLASKLASINELAQIFKKAKINLSLYNIGIEITISITLESIKKKGKKILITIDEVSNTK